MPTNFNLQSPIGIFGPTCGGWGPDGRFYVGKLNGEIVAFTFDESYAVVNQTTYPGVSGLTTNFMLGLTFSPFDPPSPVKIYVDHTELYAQGGTSFSGPSPYPGRVSVLADARSRLALPALSGRDCSASLNP